MTTENNSANSESNANTENQQLPSNDSTDIDAKIREAVEAQLKDIKSKLDSAYSQRDEALRKLADSEAEKKAAIKKQLEDEGKHKELMELQLAEERAARESAEKRNTELSRDLVVRQRLANLEFRSDKAGDVAFREIIATLVKGEDGNWKTSTGKSIEDAVIEFGKDEANAFLFKVKANNGSGVNNPSTPSDGSSKKSLFAMSQSEVLKLAAEGKL